MPERIHGGLESGALYEFSVNLNPLVSSSRVRKAVARAAVRAGRYPEQRAGRLVDLLAGLHRISSECVVAGNGSIELFYAVPPVLGIRKAWLLDPTFCEYRYVCELHGIPVEQVKPATKFEWDLRSLSKRVKKGDAVFLCNPNNPTGTLFNREDILALAGTGASVIVDEAFMDFSDNDQSVIGLASTMPNVIVIKSLTKIYSIPGLRIGFSVANRQLIRRLRALLPPWNVNGIATAVAEEFLIDGALIDRTRRFISREKSYITRALAPCADRIRLYDSAANFMLAESKDASGFISHALGHGIALRGSGGFRGLGRDFFRFAVRSRSDNRVLVESFRSYIEETGC